MNLANLIRGKREFATATPATVATLPGSKGPTVASVATVSVANLPKAITEQPPALAVHRPTGPAVLHFKLTPQPGTCPGGTLIDHGGDWLGALQSLIDRYGVLLDIEGLREFFEERAAICEFDGEQPRNEAEQAAWAECLEAIERARQTSQQEDRP